MTQIGLLTLLKEVVRVYSEDKPQPINTNYTVWKQVVYWALSV
jgi:hypothetical protein